VKKWEEMRQWGPNRFPRTAVAEAWAEAEIFKFSLWLRPSFLVCEISSVSGKAKSGVCLPFLV
jgi:hypothetical protein